MPAKVDVLGAWNPEDKAADDASIISAAHRFNDEGLMFAPVLWSRAVEGTSSMNRRRN